ncbi:MAG: methylated-DNA--[protein]-cysteine S-methyltransferase [Planctomycetota bacterium]
MNRYCATFDSPLGELHVVVDEEGTLLRIDLPGNRSHAPGERSSPSRCRHVVLQLGEYFEGKRRRFDLRLCLEGTPFQKKAWRALQRIPFGRTRSYLDQAKAIGNEKALRAVGQANGKNPIPIVVPCHRVLGKNGSLTGFGGGLAVKRWLLDHEQAVLARAAESAESSAEA